MPQIVSRETEIIQDNHNIGYGPAGSGGVLGGGISRGIGEFFVS